MAINGMNVGRDYSFGLYDTRTGNLIDFGDIQTIDIKPVKHDIKSQPYNDVPKYGYIPDGYKGSMTITRTGSALEDMQLAINTAFNNGENLTSGYLNETVKDPDGSVHRYQYTGVVFHLDDLGSISREKTITQKVEFMASDKKKLL